MLKEMLEFVLYLYGYFLVMLAMGLALAFTVAGVVGPFVGHWEFLGFLLLIPVASYAGVVGARLCI